MSDPVPPAAEPDAPPPARAVPLLALDEACVAEARRALASDGVLGAPDASDDVRVARLLLVARALPVALEAIAELLGAVRVLTPRVDAALVPSGEAIAAVPVVDEAAGHVEVRIVPGAIADTLVEHDAPVLSRLVFPFVPNGERADDGEVRLQRFGHGPTQRR